MIKNFLPLSEIYVFNDREFLPYELPNEIKNNTPIKNRYMFGYFLKRGFEGPGSKQRNKAMGKDTITQLIPMRIKLEKYNDWNKDETDI